MLYQTPYPFPFQFHPSPSSGISLLASATTQAETEMEAALKSNFRKEMAIKLSPQTFMEEFSVPNGTTSDDFFVDDLLNFSHVEEEPAQQQQQQQKEKVPASVSLQQQSPSPQPCTFKDDYPYVPTSELSVPADDVADLEWLSHFVEDSFSEFSGAFPVVKTGVAAKDVKAEPESPVLCFKRPVQTKARSKRSRNGVRVWPLGSPSFTESSSSSTTSSSSSSPSTTFLIHPNCPPGLDYVCSQPRPKKPKNKTSSDSAPRRCSHCGVHKTPQWRTGPLGPKTLCNACGVRFKSGRLLPEYRPACSPTFSSELHSNHHRKVLEMRRKKEIVAGVEATVPVVPSF